VAAKAAGLHYVTAGEPGFVRVKHGKSFLYRDQRGRSVRDPRTLDRI
jgi:DNA topoisomerase-1